MMIANLAAMWCQTALLALTASERWAAARQLNSGPTVPTWSIVVGAMALIILVVSVLAVSRSQGPRRSGPRRR